MPKTSDQILTALGRIESLLAQQIQLLERQNELLEQVSSPARKSDSELSSALTLEQQAILLIPKYRGNKSRIADALGVSRRAVYHWQDFSDACERSNQVRHKSRRAAIAIPKGAVSDGRLDAHSTESEIDAWIEAEEKRRKVRSPVRKGA